MPHFVNLNKAQTQTFLLLFIHSTPKSNSFSFGGKHNTKSPLPPKQITFFSFSYSKNVRRREWTQGRPQTPSHFPSHQSRPSLPHTWFGFSPTLFYFFIITTIQSFLHLLSLLPPPLPVFIFFIKKLELFFLLQFLFY